MAGVMVESIFNFYIIILEQYWFNAISHYPNFVQYVGIISVIAKIVCPSSEYLNIW